MRNGHRPSPHGHYTPSPPEQEGVPPVTVVVLTYNSEKWIQRCIESLRNQTLVAAMEVLIADNASQDTTVSVARAACLGLGNFSVIQHATNMGYAEGNNVAARRARGKWLLFLNPDTWLEPDCIEKLVCFVSAEGFQAASALVLDYDGIHTYSAGMVGIDVFGLPVHSTRIRQRHDLLSGEGCALIFNRCWFERLGGFDKEFFMYAEEFDLCWRLWIAGGRVGLCREAKVRHEGSASMTPNPLHHRNAVTSDRKRFLANRNNLLALLKNAHWLLASLAPLQILMLGCEACVMLIATRRWSHVKRCYLDALLSCFKLAPHVMAERRKISRERKVGDLEILRLFLTIEPARWREVVRAESFGMPQVQG